jgi:hypothetical protein
VKVFDRLRFHCFILHQELRPALWSNDPEITHDPNPFFALLKQRIRFARVRMAAERALTRNNGRARREPTISASSTRSAARQDL